MDPGFSGSWTVPAAVLSAVDYVAKGDVFKQKGVNTTTGGHQLLLNADFTAAQVRIIVPRVVQIPHDLGPVLDAVSIATSLARKCLLSNSCKNNTVHFSLRTCFLNNNKPRTAKVGAIS